MAACDARARNLATRSGSARRSSISGEDSALEVGDLRWDLRSHPPGAHGHRRAGDGGARPRPHPVRPRRHPTSQGGLQRAGRPEDRYDMVEAAVEGNERFSVDRVEVDAGRPMHSVETVQILKGALPGRRVVLHHRGGRGVQLARVEGPGPAARGGGDGGGDDGPATICRGWITSRRSSRNFDRIFPVECTRVDISATGIRRRILAGQERTVPGAGRRSTRSSWNRGIVCRR